MREQRDDAKSDVVAGRTKLRIKGRTSRAFVPQRGYRLHGSCELQWFRQTRIVTAMHLRSLLVTIALVSCNHDNAAVDAAVRDAAVPDAAVPDAAVPDAAVPIDAPPDAVALDCAGYCAEIQANCTGENAQYPDLAHCMSTCASFAVGTSTIDDPSGNTLGCRIHYAGTPARTAPATHCVHAGPGGDLITATPPAFCSGGDVCASFCALDIRACGSTDTPLPDDPVDETGNPLFQYGDMADCMRVCDDFYDKTHAYSTTAVGNSLACRLFQATEAAIAVTPNAATYCSATGMFPTGSCAGTAMP